MGNLCLNARRPAERQAAWRGNLWQDSPPSFLPPKSLPRPPQGWAKAWGGEGTELGESRGDARILTTCILLHSGVGLLQGVRGGGTLRCKGAKSTEVSEARSNQPLPYRAHGDDPGAASPLPALVLSAVGQVI